MTLQEVMNEIAEKQAQVTVKQAEIAEIGKEISALEKDGLGLEPGKNLGITDMIKLIQRVMSEAVVVSTEAKETIN
jgi:hypothetical protein